MKKLIILILICFSFIITSNISSLNMNFKNIKFNTYDFSSLKTFKIAYDENIMNIIIIHSFNKGLTIPQITALLANSMCESGHNPKAINNYGFSGLFQWNYTQKINFDLDILSQLEYLWLELSPERGRWPQPGENFNGWNPKYYKIWSNPNSTYIDCTIAFSNGYERHGSDENTELRIKIAHKINYILTNKIIKNV